MNKSQKIKSSIILCLFLAAAILCGVLMNNVSINYSISDYLDESTDTKIALQLIEDEFGLTTDIKVMVRDIDKDTAEDVADMLSEVDKVLSVNFDSSDTSYYKDNTALFVVMLDGDDYSSETGRIVDNIKAVLSEQLDEEIVYGGTSVEKRSMRENIASEMAWILAIAVVLVVAILLLMSASWLEPIVLLLATGVAILFNLGTNLIFGEISYITNSVAAILQLALSIDYSIVLLHTYRAKKATVTDSAVAMKQALKEVLSPVSASALTTIAGLVALLFMSFKIGFDIGIVLMKGIIISLVCSLTLFPLLILWMEKPMNKTKKKALSIKGRSFCRLAERAGKVIFPIFLVLVIVCGVFSNAFTSYIFAEPSDEGKDIEDIFGVNNTVILVYKNGEDNLASEKEFYDRVALLEKSDGSPMLIDFTSYSNTVKELYDVDKIVKKLNISEADATYLLTMYHLYLAPDSVKINTEAFIEYADELIQNDADASDFADGETNDTLKKMLHVSNVMNAESDAEGFHTLMTTGALSGTELSLFSVKQMYGLYFYDEITDKTVDFETMLDHMIAVTGEGGELTGTIDADTLTQLGTLSAGIKQFNTQMEQPLTKAEFQGFMYQTYGVQIDDTTATQLYQGYYLTKGETPQDTIPFLPLMTFLVSQNQITDATAIDTISGYNALYSTINASYGYEQFLPALTQIATGLSGTAPTITATNDEIQQIYISYFNKIGSVPNKTILGRTFVEFVSQQASEKAIIAEQLGDENAKQLFDMQKVDSFMSDSEKYSYIDMADKLNALQSSLEGITSEAMSSDKVSGVYIKYATSSDIADISAVSADALVNFVSDNKDTNELLSVKLSDENRKSLDDAKEDINTATDLFLGENYSRLLLSLDLPTEGEDTKAFMEAVIPIVDDIFGEEAYLAGEIPSTHDLKETFEFDNLLISVFTIVSIFVIVLIVFRSLSLPTILVIVIQGAIWLMMSLLILIGKDVFFMSYIIATCILMGATIDYGILMSNSYVTLRRSLDKHEALEGAIEAAMPTVFTSGTILTVAGLVISIISTQNSISTVGLLVGVGALSSTIFIIFVLPSILHTLDKFVMKLTVKKK